MPKTEKDEEAQLRTRWQRWLGQVCRVDRPGWVELLKSDYLVFLSKVLGDEHVVMAWNTPKEKVVEQYRKAISRATADQLRILDMLYCDKEFNRRFH